MTDKKHTYKVPVTGHANIVVAADSPEEAQEIAPDYAETVDFTRDSDPAHLEDVQKSEDRYEMWEAKNVKQEPKDPDAAWRVDVPSYPNGSALKKAREGLGLSQQDVADALGLGSRSTVSAWENDDNLTLRDARRYASLLRSEQRKRR